MPAKSSARKWVCAKPVAPPSSPSAEFAQRIATSALARLGDRLTVGLQTLTLPIQVRILVPQPYTQNPPQGGFCVCRRSEEHTSELKSLMRISYAVFCFKTKNIS